MMRAMLFTPSPAFALNVMHAFGYFFFGRYMNINHCSTTLSFLPNTVNHLDYEQN